MKILAITNMYPSPESPSQGIFVQEQIKGLCAIGLEVKVLFVNRRRFGPMAYYQLGDAIHAAVAEFEPDVIHVMYGGIMADQIIRHYHLCPVVVTFRGSDVLGENLSGWKRKLISHYGVYCSRRAAKKADGIVVVASHLKKALKCPASEKKIRVIPSGIDLDRFKLMDSVVCKQALGWNSNTFHVLFASNSNDPVKRPWLAKAAVECARKTGCPAEFHYLTGIPSEQMPLWLNAGDALLLTSKHEGSPNIVKESLACGLPVVSVDVGDVAERLDGVEACYIAIPEPAALGEKLRSVWLDGRRVNCGDKLAQLSILAVAQRLKLLYEEITKPQVIRGGLSKVKQSVFAPLLTVAATPSGGSFETRHLTFS